MTSLLALCKWNPLDTGGFHSQGEIDAVPLICVQFFGWTNCWTNIRVAGGLRRYHSHFHYWNFDRLSYSFKLERCFFLLSPTTKFHAYYGTYLHCLCMQADGQGATDNEYTPTPIPRGKRYSHRYLCYLVLVSLKVQFLKKENDSWAN